MTLLIKPNDVVNRYNNFSAYKVFHRTMLVKFYVIIYIIPQNELGFNIDIKMAVMAQLGNTCGTHSE